MKVFIFAGHDTTNATFCYVFYLLSRHPLALRRIRAEHDDVFGPDLTQTAAIINTKSQSLKQLPFMLAVIKKLYDSFLQLLLSVWFLMMSQGPARRVNWGPGASPSGPFR